VGELNTVGMDTCTSEAIVLDAPGITCRWSQEDARVQAEEEAQRPAQDQACGITCCIARCRRCCCSCRRYGCCHCSGRSCSAYARGEASCFLVGGHLPYGWYALIPAERVLGVQEEEQPQGTSSLPLAHRYAMFGWGYETYAYRRQGV